MRKTGEVPSSMRCAVPSCGEEKTLPQKVFSTPVATCIKNTALFFAVEEVQNRIGYRQRMRRTAGDVKIDFIFFKE